MDLDEEVKRLGPQRSRITIESTLDGGAALQPYDLGVGISQAVPVIVACLLPATPHRGRTACMVALEQPELHLHPRQQAPLGDLFIQAALAGPGHTLLVETHSEHLLLRLLRRIRQQHEGTLPSDATGLRPEDIAVVYVRTGEDGSFAKELRISPEGEFLDEWPDGFFDERGKELFE